MLFFIFVNLLLIVLIPYTISLHEYSADYSDYGKFRRFILTIGDWLEEHDGVVLGTTIINGVIVFIMVCIIIGNCLTKQTNIIRCDNQYNKIMYMIENEYVHDEFNLVNKEIIEEITNWNADLQFYQEKQRDFWIGIFIPNVFDRYQLIEYP